MWRGSEVPTWEQGIRVLGVLSGSSQQRGSRVGWVGGDGCVSVADGLRLPEFHDRAPRAGRQHEGAVCVERRFRAATFFPRMEAIERAVVQSQAGPNAGVALSTCPSSPLTRIESPLFRVFLQRRFSLPPPLSQRICGCGLPNDTLGHHRAACSRTGLLGRRGFLFESAAVATNMFVRNMDLGVPNAADNRRLEVVVDGLPLFGGVQLAVDTTLVSALKGDGFLRRGASNRDGGSCKRTLEEDTDIP